MQVKYEIENNVLKIKATPKNDAPMGLTITYGDVQKMDGDIGHIPAIQNDIYAGQTEYELPPVGAIPSFSVDKITEVDVDEKAFDVIKRYGA